MPQYLTQGQIDEINNAMPALQLGQVGSYLDKALGSMINMGNKYYLDPVNGNDSNDGKSPQTAFLTLPAAYAALTANQNDTLYILGGASSLALKSAFTWNKSYTHCIGLAAPSRFGGRVRIGHAGTANIGTLFTVASSGSIFSNLHFQHGVNPGNANNLICVDISGLRNTFIGCHFEGSLDSVASGSSYSWRAVQLEASAQANEFRSCTFGTWTVQWASANGVLVQMVGDNADTGFEDCDFLGNTTASMKFVGFTGPISGADSEVVFMRCRFRNIGTAITGGVFGVPTNGHVMLHDCEFMGFTIWSATNANLHVWGVASAATGGLSSTPA